MKGIFGIASMTHFLLIHAGYCPRQGHGSVSVVALPPILSSAMPPPYLVRWFLFPGSLPDYV